MNPTARRAPELRTRRLRLRPLVAADSDELHGLWTAPRVREFLFDGEAIPRQQTDDIVAGSNDLFVQHGYGLWAVRQDGDSRLIGFTGLWHFHEPPQLELLYGVAASEWGNGYAPEAAAAVVDYAFNELAFDAIVASMDAPNVASVRVAEKLGMQFWKQQQADGKDTVFYRRTKLPGTT